MIEYSNAVAERFLNLFGIEKGNGMSPFLTSMDTPSELKDKISQFFKPPKLDNRGRGMSVMSGSTSNIDDYIIDEVNDNGEEGEDNNAIDTGNALSPEMIASHVSFINKCNSESASDYVDNNENDSIQDADKHDCTAVSRNKRYGATRGMISSNCIEEFMELMNCKNLEAVSGLALNFMQLLELGNCHLDLFIVRANTCRAIKGGSRPRREGGVVMQQWWRRTIKQRVPAVVSLNKNLLLGTAWLSYSAYMGQKTTPKPQLSTIGYFPSLPKPTTSGTWQ